MNCYWTNLDALETTKAFGFGPLSISPAPRSGALEPFASPKEALEALFQSYGTYGNYGNYGPTSWEPPTTSATSATTILDQASFPPSVFLSQSRDAQPAPTSFHSSLVGQQMMSDKVAGTSLTSGDEADYKIGSLSPPIAKTSIALSCSVSDDADANTLRPVKPIKGMIRKHKQYLTSLDMTRPNVCTHCLARFERPSDCERHMRSHTNEAQYWCHNPDCPIDRRFTQYTRSDARQRHWEKHVACWEWYYRSPMGVEYLEENGQRLRKFPPSILNAFVAQGIEPPKPRAPPKTKMSSTPPVEQPKRTPAQRRVRPKPSLKIGKRRISPRKHPHRRGVPGF